MTIEIIIFPGLVFLAVTLAAKLIERRNDVLYGPYIAGRGHPFADLRDQLEEVAGSIGLQQSFGRFALKLGTVSLFASAIIG
ncbi:hypothetical protein [Bradyrhizobium sp.]|uniref:hypothetical protein n=1 Tax=Bradyrhizobium sp. TaxID=376 RepID=UPI003C75F3DD